MCQDAHIYSVSENSKVLVLRRCGGTARDTDVTNMINSSKTVIYNILINSQNYGKQKRTDGPESVGIRY